MDEEAAQCIVEDEDCQIECDPREAEKIDNQTYTSIWGDTVSIIKLFVPICIMIGSEFMINVIQLIFIGRLGALEMGAVALATSFCNVTGFSVTSGLLSALDTLSAQAFGANNLKKIGMATNQSFIGLAIVTLLTLPVWMFSDKILLMLQQDPEVIELASVAIKITWIGLYPASINSTLRRYLQNQNQTRPLVLSGIFSLCFSTSCIAILMLCFNVGYIAAPISMVLTKCASCIFFAIYIYFLGIWKLTWVPFSKETILGMVTWFKLAIPGMVMLCAEWWSFEINIFVAGIISVDSLAAMTLLYTMLTLIYTVSTGMSVSASVKVGNAIGEENIPRAKQVSWLVFVIVFSVEITLAILLYVFQDFWPLVFTAEEGVLTIVKEVSLLISMFCIIDAMQNTLGGIIRGCGKQFVGAFAYIGSYYLVGLSLGIPLALAAGMGVKGLWIGITSASTSCLMILGSYFILKLNWESVVADSRSRLTQKENDTAEPLVEEMEEFLSGDSYDVEQIVENIELEADICE